MSRNCHSPGLLPPYRRASLAAMTAPRPNSRIAVVEVVITEELDLWALPRLSALLEDALDLQPVQLVVDLARCPFMDAAAIGVLLEAHRQARRCGGLLTLRSPSPRLRRNLRLARADRVLHVTPEAADFSEADDPAEAAEPLSTAEFPQTPGNDHTAAFPEDEQL